MGKRAPHRRFISSSVMLGKYTPAEQKAKPPQEVVEKSMSEIIAEEDRRIAATLKEFVWKETP